MASATLTAEPVGAWQRVWYRLQHSGNWIYLVPALIFFFGYQVYPIIRVFIISFTDYHFLRTGDPINFVGFENYATAVGDQIVYQGLGRALYFT
ncbi:MAG: hypothetical protein L0Z53_25745, partial [Acidobacteriales bacterium]|nr:hypothetical protein [Terriglobales bacterium]